MSVLLTSVLLFTWAEYLFETYLQLRQHRKYLAADPAVPSELDGLVSKDQVVKSNSYNRDKSLFTLVSSLYSQIELSLVLYFNGIPFLWRLNTHLGEAIATRYNLGMCRSELFISVLFTVSSLIITFVSGLAWTTYYTFVIEQKHGFNKQTFKFFMADKIKSLALYVVVSVILVVPMLALIKKGGKLFVVYVWMFFLAFSIFLMTIYPTLIAPLFDKYVTLPSGELKTRIEQLAKSISFPLAKIFVVIASKRSSHSNAYLYGFFHNKRVVLFDTLLNEETKMTLALSDVERQDMTKDQLESKMQHACTDEEIVGILAHEFGHWKMSHTLKSFALSQANLILIFYIFGALMDNSYIYHSFGFYGSKPTLMGLLIVFECILLPLNFVVSFASTLLSRKFEFEADRYAKKLGYAAALKSALVKLQIANLSAMDPDRWYSTFHYSHPPLIERLEALNVKID